MKQTLFELNDLSDTDKEALESLIQQGLVDKFILDGVVKYSLTSIGKGVAEHLINNDSSIKN